MDLDGDDVEEELLKSLAEDDEIDDDNDDEDDEEEEEEEGSNSRLSGYCTEGGESAVDQDQIHTGFHFLVIHE
jgi:hypothetical protein